MFKRPLANILLLATWLLAAVHQPLRAGDALDESVHLRTENNSKEQKTQKRIDDLSDETRSMLEEYHTLNRELGALKIYNGQVERLVKSQEEEKALLERQMVDIELTQREIVPLMLRMIEALATFLDSDAPFLPDERRQRVRLLRELMDRSDVSVAEKYRRVLEAYQIEIEYSRTIEAYRDELEIDGVLRTVDVLRVGRVGLQYQTLDGKQSGYWDASAKAWIALSGQDSLAIRQGLRVARKQVAPDLLRIEVAVPERDIP